MVNLSAFVCLCITHSAWYRYPKSVCQRRKSSTERYLEQYSQRGNEEGLNTLVV